MNTRPPDTPRVAVIIPAWNQAPFLEAAVVSVLDQTETSLEVVIVDDGSTDDTEAVASRLASRDQRVRLLRTTNAGPGAARNAGLRVSRAAYVVFLDADDLLPPAKLLDQAGYLDAHDGVDIVYSVAHRFFDDDPLASEPVPGIRDGVELSAGLLAGADRAFPLHAAMSRRSVIERIGGFRELRPLVEDVDLWMRAAFHDARFAFHDTEPVLYRKVRGTRSTMSTEVHEGYLAVHEWLARRAHALPAHVAAAVRRKTRYRTLFLAGRRTLAGNGLRSRGLALRSLRWGRSPGEWSESLLLALLPGRTAVLAAEAPGDGTLPPRGNSLGDPDPDR